MIKSFFVIFVCFGCALLGQSIHDTPVLYLEKNACYGQCPVYKLEIFLSGKMTFNGIANTKFNGHYCSNIDKNNLNRLIEEFNRKNYLSMEDNYLSRAKDLPTTTTGFKYNGKQKRICDYDKAPPELKQLEKMLETLADTTSWNNCQ